MGIGILDHFCSCDLDLDPMTFMYELTRIPWRYTGCANMNSYVKAFECYRLTDTQTDRQTDRIAGGEKVGAYRNYSNQSPLFSPA